MTGRFSLLRQLSTDAQRLQVLQQTLGRCQAGGSMQPVPGVPCLRFRLQGNDGTLDCLLRAQDWLGFHQSALHGLDLTALDAAQLQGLCTGDQPVVWDQPWLQYHHAQLLGLVVPASHAPHLPQLHSALGPVWVEALQGEWPGPGAPIEVTGQECLPIRLRVARLQRDVQRLRRLRAGDILLLPDIQLQAWRAHCCLFDFHLQPESLVVTTLYPDGADLSPEAPTAEPAEATPMLDLARLPLTLEVVLGTLQLSLAELAALGPGSALALPARAYQQVRIEHNGHCVATGELVQLGDTLGIQLAQAPRLQ